jgi:hypothetical protein
MNLRPPHYTVTIHHADDTVTDLPSGIELFSDMLETLSAPGEYLTITRIS